MYSVTTLNLPSDPNLTCPEIVNTAPDLSQPPKAVEVWIPSVRLVSWRCRRLAGSTLSTTSLQPKNFPLGHWSSHDAQLSLPSLRCKSCWLSIPPAGGGSGGGLLMSARTLPSILAHPQVNFCHPHRSSLHLKNTAERQTRISHPSWCRSLPLSKLLTSVFCDTDRLTLIRIDN